MQYWPMFLRETGEFAGCAGLRPFHADPAELEAGVHIARRFWSRRLGEEAIRAVLHHGFRVLGLPFLVAGHHPEHSASQAMMGRLGFRFTHREPWPPLLVEPMYYRMTAEEFSAKSAPTSC